MATGDSTNPGRSLGDGRGVRAAGTPRHRHENGLVRASVSRPKAVLAAILVLTGLAATAIPGIQIRLDARTLVPAGHPALRASDTAAQLFQRRDVVVIGLQSPGSIVNADSLPRIARLTRRIATLASIDGESVVSLASYPQLEMIDHGLRISHVAPSERRLDRTELSRVQQAVDSLGLADGTLLSADHRTAMIVAEVRPGADRYQLQRDLDAIAAGERDGTDRLLVTGTALAQAALGQAVGRDLLQLVPAVVLVIGTLLGLAFRAPGPALISLAEIAVSLVWTAGLIGLFHQSLFVTTLVLPVILIAVGVSDDIHVLRHYFSRGGAGAGHEGIVSAFTEITPAVLLTTSSTILGLASLAMTPLAPLRVFGLFGAAAIGISTLMTFTLVPALLSMLERRPGARAPQSVSFGRSFGLLLRLRPAALPCAATILAISVPLLMWRLRVDDSWIGNLPSQSDVVRADRTLNAAMAGTMTLDFLIDTGASDRLLQPQILESLGGFEDALGAVRGVGAVTSVFDDLCRVRASVGRTNYADYRGAVRSGEHVLSAAEAAQAMLLLSSIRQPSLARRVDDRNRRARVTVFIRDATYPVIRGVLADASRAAARLLPGAQIVPFGDAWVNYETVQILVQGQTLALPLGILADFALVAVVMRSLRLAAAALAPVVVGSVIVFDLFALAAVPIGIASSMFTGLALGVGTDFSIHLVAVLAGFGCAEFGDGVMSETGSSIVISALAMASGFAVLLLSGIGPTVQLGAAIATTVVVCGLSAVVLGPALIWALRPHVEILHPDPSVPAQWGVSMSAPLDQDQARASRKDQEKEASLG